MYLRSSITRKKGKEHTYWRLVRSVRRNGKCVQETVAQLGELDARGCAIGRALARQMSGRREQLNLFEPKLSGEEVVPIRVQDVRVERGRAFGDVWLGYQLWKMLRLDEACTHLMDEGREQVPWATMAAILVIARLCDPSSELHIAESWYRKTALEDVLGVPPEVVNDDRLYRALDKLLPHKEEIERHLKTRLGELFQLDYELLLYDVTSTYFEGLAERNLQARRGHSRDHRPDCKQVCIALVVTRDGMPVGYEVFDGNRVDVTTVQEVVETMEKRFGLAHRIWVMDRGMTSAENIAWLQQNGRRYVIGTSKSEIRRWGKELADHRDWQVIRQGVEVKLCDGPEGKETFVLCRSAERTHKEKAMHDRFSEHIEKGLLSLARRLEKATSPLERGPIERQIGRLLGRNTRAAGRYQIQLLDAPHLRSQLQLSWVRREQWDDWARLTEGCYVLRTNIRDWTPEQLWQTYIQLTDAEAAFRIQKSDLSIRPIWHQREDRVQAHILVCFLAYASWKSLEKWQEKAGLGNSPRTLIDELANIQSVDVILPTAEIPSRELRLRCVVRPTPAQNALLQRLGLQLPQRLRLNTGAAKM